MAEYGLFPTLDHLRTNQVIFQREIAAIAGYCGIDGMEVARASSSSVTISSGHYRAGGVISITYNGGSLSAIPAASTGCHRYDLVVMDCSDFTIKRIAGSEFVPDNALSFLENLKPYPPIFPHHKIYLLAIICVDSAGIRSTNNGGYSIAGVADLRIINPIASDNNYVSLSEHLIPLSQNKIPIHDGNYKFITRQNLFEGAPNQFLDWIIRTDPPANPSAGNKRLYNTAAGWFSKESDGTIKAVGSGSGAGVWNDMPGTPTRIDTNHIQLDDPGNLLKLDKVFARHILLRWYESGAINVALTTSATYAADHVEVYLVGDSLDSPYVNLQYCTLPPKVLEWYIPGYMALGTSIARYYQVDMAMFKLACDWHVLGQGVGASSIIDINDDGVSIFSTRPTLPVASNDIMDVVCLAPSTPIAVNSIITLDVDQIASTTPVADSYIRLYLMPVSWAYFSIPS